MVLMACQSLSEKSESFTEIKAGPWHTLRPAASRLSVPNVRLSRMKIWSIHEHPLDLVNYRDSLLGGLLWRRHYFARALEDYHFQRCRTRVYS